MKEMLQYLLDPSDPDRGYVSFAATDEILLLVNNMGGLSQLELAAFTNVVLNTLGGLYFYSTDDRIGLLN